MSLAHNLHALLGQYGSAAVFAALFFEHFGLPLPGESLLIGAAVLASRGEIPIGILLASAWLGATLGNAVGFAIGRYGGRHLVLRHGAKVGITERRFLSVETTFARYGDVVLVGARFVVLLRQLSGIGAGTLGMGWGRFMALNTLGAALWVGWWGLVSYWAGERVFDAVSDMAGIEYVILALSAAAALWLSCAGAAAVARGFKAQAQSVRLQLKSASRRKITRPFAISQPAFSPLAPRPSRASETPRKVWFHGIVAFGFLWQGVRTRQLRVENLALLSVSSRYPIGRPHQE